MPDRHKILNRGGQPDAFDFDGVKWHWIGGQPFSFRPVGSDVPVECRYIARKGLRFFFVRPAAEGQEEYIIERELIRFSGTTMDPIVHADPPPGFDATRDPGTNAPQTTASAAPPRHLSEAHVSAPAEIGRHIVRIRDGSTQAIDFAGARWWQIEGFGPTYGSPGCDPIRYILPNGGELKRYERPFHFAARTADGRYFLVAPAGLDHEEYILETSGHALKGAETNPYSPRSPFPFTLKPTTPPPGFEATTAEIEEPGIAPPIAPDGEAAPRPAEQVSPVAQRSDPRRLAAEMRRRRPTAAIQLKLLEYMADRESADVEDVARDVHCDKDTSDEAIRQNVWRVNSFLAEMESRLRFKCGSGRVVKVESPL